MRKANGTENMNTSSIKFSTTLNQNHHKVIVVDTIKQSKELNGGRGTPEGCLVITIFLHSKYVPGYVFGKE